MTAAVGASMTSSVSCIASTITEVSTTRRGRLKEHNEPQGDVMSPRVLNVCGLLCNLVGVLLLFRYGMPYRIATGGRLFRWELNATDEQIRRRDLLYRFLGWIGVVAIVVGTGLQVWATLRQA